MKITKRKLKQIIREELEAVMGDESIAEESYSGDGDVPVLEPDELGLGQMNEVAELADLAMGTALAVAVVYGAQRLGTAAGSILGRLRGVAERELTAIQRYYRDEYRVEIEDAMKRALDSDPDLETLAMKYQELTDRVQKTPDDGGIKGLRGSEYAEIRKQQKEVAKQFAIKVKEAVSRAAQSIEDNPDLRGKGSKLTGDDAYRVRDTASQYARRRRG
ncbi:MAG: hypothetical protein ACO3JZ_01915 [Schleiferiaceae bacterium]